MPGRKYAQAASYRYGFNAKENDNEVKGEGNQQDYGMRIYDPRLGRFLSVDPISAKYSELTPYQFASNRPIDGINLDGLEYLNFNTSIYRFVPSVSSSETVMFVIYENIPTQLQDPQTCDLRFSGYGPLNTDGTEYDPSKQGPRIFDNSKFERKNANFYGAASEGRSTNGINSLKGNAVPGASTVNGDNASMSNTINTENISSVGGALGPSGLGGIFSNAWNYILPWSDQAGLIEEAKKRDGFSKAVQRLDNGLVNGILPTVFSLGVKGHGEIMTPILRGALINFMADGTLDASNPQSAMEVAWYGIQLLRNDNIQIQNKTKLILRIRISKILFI